MLPISLVIAIIAIVVGLRRFALYSTRKALKQGGPNLLAALGRSKRFAYELVPQLTPHAANEDPAIRRAVIEVLLIAPGEAAERVVRAHIADPDPEVRALATSRILGDQ